MILDSQTNFLYLADTLKKEKYSNFLTRFEKSLKENGIWLGLLPKTKDIWAVDYMPIQVQEDRFVQFKYYPDYLRKDKKGLSTISDTDSIRKTLAIETLTIEVEKSDIIIDGGNVICGRNKVIMCDKVFKENPQYDSYQLISELKWLFEVEEIIFIPTLKNDQFGHADGIVRFLNEDTVLINNYNFKEKAFKIDLQNILENAGLDFIEIPYNPYKNEKEIQANGIYINYLQMEDIIFIPIFEIREDEIAIKQFEQLFKNQRIIPVYSNEIANEGGVLNCISWNIQLALQRFLIF